MDGSVWLYAILGVILVVVINLALVVMLRGGGSNRQINIARQVIWEMSDPYRKEEDMLSELSRRVEDLK
ncbi:MAG TPA: hypothetical protein VLH85_06015 [Levilinea sp.]|nr:hypothetical protein [Levilinea sp.]